jgi:hypothetical protein
MSEAQEKRFNLELAARVKALRKTVFKNADQMATRLGVTPDAYRKYEQTKDDGTRKPTPISPYLIPTFAAIVGRSVEFVLTGAEANAGRARHLGGVWSEPDPAAAARALVASLDALGEQSPELLEQIRRRVLGASRRPPDPPGGLEPRPKKPRSSSVSRR